MKYILRSKIKHRRFGRSFIFLPVALPKLAMTLLTLDDFLTYQIFLFIFFEYWHLRNEYAWKSLGATPKESSYLTYLRLDRG